MSRPVETPVSGWRRLLRVGVLGGASFALGAGAHLAGGGAAPSWPLAVMAVAVLGSTAAAVTTRQRGFAFLGLLVAGQQVVLHLALALGDAAGATCAPTAHAHHELAMTCAATGAVPAAPPTVPMLLAHLFATAVTAWLLARGEAWLWRVLRRAFTVPVAVLAAPVPRLPHSCCPAPRVLSRQTRPAAPRGPPGTAAPLAA